MANPGYYVYYGKLNEYPWIIVSHRPDGIALGKKWYAIGGAKEEGDGFAFKTAFLPYRVDRKNRHLLGDRVDAATLPKPIQDFIAQEFSRK